jgi:Lrp/AsnC family transcriptional regulator for asnA, asnC and gidA
LSKTVTLDGVDEKIIAVLQENGRLSNRAVGRSLGLSESAIRKRMARMIRDNAISFGLVVDTSATRMACHGWLSVEVHPAHARRATEAIGAMEICSLSALTSGAAAIQAYVYAADLNALAGLTSTISSFEGVTHVNFRQTIRHPRHRYELIVLAEKDRSAAWNVAADASPTQV